jgi:integrase/recombinase XerD
MNWTKPIVHKTENIAVYFLKNANIPRIKQIDGARWSQQKVLWHIPDTIKQNVST